MSAVIETRGLTKTYGKSRGIENVNLSVEEGEVFGFLGPNGAGKTTTIRTLLGFMKPTGGSAEIFGMDIVKDSVDIRSMVGNLPGEFTLEDRMTGEQLLRFFARLRGVESLDYAHELAERIDADLHRPMRRLSRGNKQKIGLVQAMFHRPPLLVLDEPTGGLDPLVQEEFLRMIGEVRDEGRAVFFSSHNLPEVERVCDRVGIIRDGELTAVEPTDTLINKSFRHVSLTFSRELNREEAGRFERLEGVEGFDRNGPEITFDLHGDLDQMIKLAARHELVDMRYERPSLEEIFLAYYGGETANDESRNAAKGAQSPPPSSGKGPARGPNSLESGKTVTMAHEESAARRPNCSPSFADNDGNGAAARANAGPVPGGAEVEPGPALQRAVEAIVEQTVERNVERLVEKGERS